MKRACTEEQINERKKEIISIVNTMFDTVDYQDISMKTISEKISIARSSLYCYYNSKEEIMLDIIRDDYIHFLNQIISSFNKENSIEELSKDLANCYLGHMRLLKIISIYLVDIEIHSSLEKVIVFKSNFVKIFKDFDDAINSRFQTASSQDKLNLSHSLVMLTHSLYPAINPLEKQVEAMKAVGMNTVNDKYAYIYNYLMFILKQL
ncbi:MAG: TetR/AcrR family transcriptional regulator [Bacilli bacterium]